MSAMEAWGMTQHSHNAWNCISKHMQAINRRPKEHYMHHSHKKPPLLQPGYGLVTQGFGGVWVWAGPLCRDLWQPLPGYNVSSCPFGSEGPQGWSHCRVQEKLMKLPAGVPATTPLPPSLCRPSALCSAM